MFTEDIGAFFSEAEFAVTAIFTPTLGGAPVSASVIFNAQTQDVFGDAVLSDEFSIVYPATALVGVKAGDRGTVNGVEYKIRDIRLKADGTLVTAKLSKV